MQSKFLFTNEKCTWDGRKSGYTTAYMVKLALNKEIEIKLTDLKRGKYSDEIHGDSYDAWFYREFIEVRELLSSVGLNVVKIIKS